MRPARPFLAVSIALLLSSAVAPLLAAAADPSSDAPTIAKIRGRTVTVTVPSGYDSVSLQSVRIKQIGRAKPERLWATLDTQFPQGSSTTLTFRLTKLTPRRLLRVYGSPANPLPDSFLAGVTSFGADKLSLSNTNTGVT